jgi:streptomycin 6-kinase
VRRKAIALGQTAWLDVLQSLVPEVAREWELTVGRVFQEATEALVVEATLSDGTAAVLKLLVPGRVDAARREALVLDLVGGEGCARLIRSDLSRGALLLERLGPSLHDLALPIHERHDILCATVQRVWRPAGDQDLPSGAAKARALAEAIVSDWEELDHPCSEAAVEHALMCATRRAAAHDDQCAVLVHGDVHEWNTLAAPDGFKLVDPDGLLAEPECDLGVIMREDPLELLIGDPHARSQWLATRTGCQEPAIWEWGVIERISTGLLCERVGLQPVGRQMLAVADHLARGERSAHPG